MHHNNSISKFEFDSLNTPSQEKDESLKFVETKEFDLSLKNEYEYTTYSENHHRVKL